MVFFISTKYLPQSLTMIGPSWSFNISFHPRFSRFCVACLLLVYNTNVPNLPSLYEIFPPFLPQFLLPPPIMPSTIHIFNFSVFHPHFHISSPSLSYFLTFTFIFSSSFRRRSKAHQAALHSYCVSSSSSGLASQFYDDLYISNHR